LRWEGQSDIHDWKDLAPRFGLAWMPRAHGGKGAKTVIRLGAGVFYDRFGDNQMLQALRFNGSTQRQFVLDNPSFFPRCLRFPRSKLWVFHRLSVRLTPTSARHT
jgi:hypothetical protein